MGDIPTLTCWVLAGQLSPGLGPFEEEPFWPCSHSPACCLYWGTATKPQKPLSAAVGSWGRGLEEVLLTIASLSEARGKSIARSQGVRVSKNSNNGGS